MQKLPIQTQDSVKSCVIFMFLCSNLHKFITWVTTTTVQSPVCLTCQFYAFFTLLLCFNEYIRQLKNCYLHTLIILYVLYAAQDNTSSISTTQASQNVGHPCYIRQYNIQSGQYIYNLGNKSERHVRAQPSNLLPIAFWLNLLAAILSLNFICSSPANITQNETFSQCKTGSPL